MNKLLALISPIAVCAPIVAVAVFSSLPSSNVVAAVQPASTGLVTTRLVEPNTYPTFTFDSATLEASNTDLSASVSFCPSGWETSSPLVSPQAYGAFSIDKGFFTCTFTFHRLGPTTCEFLFNAVSTFYPDLDGLELFSNLYINNVTGEGFFPSQNCRFMVICPNNYGTQFTNLSSEGDEFFNPSDLDNPVIFELTGLIGNYYDEWLLTLTDRWHSAGYSDGYSAGNSAGYSSGYVVGNSAGNSAGYSNGYYMGSYDGNQDGNSRGYSNGYSAGLVDGYDNGSSAGYANGVNAGVTQFGIWDLFSNAFGSVANVLGINIFPGVTVGLLLSVPIAFAFILWLIHVLKG